MESEWNLSDKIDPEITEGTGVELLTARDVREFIKRLKEVSHGYKDKQCNCESCFDIDEAIDKLAGDKLC